eukprot:jgi/Astpho2/693/e_gw1.00013.62.1_t
MQDFVLDKLKLLKYEQEFCRQKHRLKPVHRAYFALPAPLNQQNEQFYYFTSLVSWLLNLSGHAFQPPQQYDDPNITCTNIMSALREAGFAPASFPPAKLRQGHGDPVCGVLSALCDLALERQQFKFQAPQFQEEQYVEEAEVDDEAEVTADIDEEVRQQDIAGFSEACQQDGAEQLAMSGQVAWLTLFLQVDPAEWRLELERVAPRLRITMPLDAKDWRLHLEQAHQHSEQICKLWPDGQTALQKVLTEVTTTLDKLAMRERFVNAQCEHLIGVYQVAREHLAQLQQQYAAKQDAAAETENKLAQVTRELEDRKQELEDRGSSISNTSPIVRIKAAIKQLKDELCQMRVRTGVLEHQLLQISLKQRGHLSSTLL